jgi:molybdopterin synthase sulfur carrier subunit
VQVTVRYFAAAKAAAGLAEERIQVADRETLGALLDRIAERLSSPEGGRGAEVIARCSVLRNGESGSGRETRLADGDSLDLLPPFAGG